MDNWLRILEVSMVLEPGVAIQQGYSAQVAFFTKQQIDEQLKVHAPVARACPDQDCFNLQPSLLVKRELEACSICCVSENSPKG